MAVADLSRVPPFYHRYIQLVSAPDLNRAFEQHQNDLTGLLRKLAADKWSYRYAPGKWSIRELVQHIIDGERIFGYRALCIARKDRTALPGFDENSYAAASNANDRNAADIMEELTCVQKSSMLLFRSFNEEQLQETGIANGNPVYVEAIGYIIIGHTLHHKKVLEDKYLG